MMPAESQIDQGGDTVSSSRGMDHEEYYAIADAVLPGGGLGANTLPAEVRFVIDHGEGSRLQDVRGNWYIDYLMGAGALILGHAHPATVAAAQAQAGEGLHFYGTLNIPCIEMAKILVEAIPCAEKIVFVSTGSEATFFAMRIARAYTGRNKILKFEGGYHGNHDYSSFSVLPAALSNYPAGRPDTAGLPPGVSESVLVAPYNDVEATRRIVAAYREDLAAIIVEPVQRIIFPVDGFLDELRAICDEYDVLLIFDEVVTGFRLAYGGGQEYFGVRPDLACYGKIIGGGSPLGCIAGKAELIDRCDPVNKGKPDYAYVSGTFHGNPVALATGLATLTELRKPGFYDRLHSRSRELTDAFQRVLDRHNLSALVIGGGSLWQTVFMARQPVSHADFMAADLGRSRALDIAMLKNGLYVMPGMRRFVSAAHTDADFEDTVRAFDSACRTAA
jgi:glutamate-1-semialdehyde 2,1-aminomutase